MQHRGKLSLLNWTDRRSLTQLDLTETTSKQWRWQDAILQMLMHVMQARNYPILTADKACPWQIGL
jgi:hypothetical protein